LKCNQVILFFGIGSLAQTSLSIREPQTCLRQKVELDLMALIVALELLYTPKNATED